MIHTIITAFALKMFSCEACEFSTDKHSNYLKHLETKRHRESVNLYSFCKQKEYGYQNKTSYAGPSTLDHEESVFSSTDTMAENFYPFTNRLELLLYVIRGSKYHHIDQELFKFILHIIRVVIEDRITVVPPFHKIWNMKIDGLELKPSVMYNGRDSERVKNLIMKSKQLDMDLYTVPVNIFVDDTSGNRSKKWNPLNVWTMQLAGLPTKDKMKKSSHHFIGVTNTEEDCLTKPIVYDLNDMFYDGKVMFDAMHNTNVIITSQIAVGLMDNAMAIEFCHLMGAAAKENCRFCRYGSNPIQKGEPRTKEQTEELLVEIESSSNSRELSTLYGIKRKLPAVEMNNAANWDPHRDIPPDMLHCRYLGDVAILLKCILNGCSDLQKENLQLVINQCEWRGFHHRCSENFVKYHRSCQGKDFKAFVQLAPFVMHRSGFNREIVQLWCLLSELIHLINKSSLTESELSRLGDIQIDFNEKIYSIFPETKKKQKIHHNLHTEDLIRQHGVPIGYTTEAGESWCGIVKNIQYITNHHNPNKDTAQKVARVEEICHVVENGTWLSGDQRTKIGKQAWEDLQNPIVQRFVFGNGEDRESEYQLKGTKRKDDSEKKAKGSRLQIGDVIFYKSNDQICFGEVREILNDEIEITTMLKDGNSKDAIFKCHILKKTAINLKIALSSIDGLVYVAHDCYNGGCCYITTGTSRKFKHNLKHSVYLINRFKINFNSKIFS